MFGFWGVGFFTWMVRWVCWLRCRLYSNNSPFLERQVLFLHCAYLWKRAGDHTSSVVFIIENRYSQSMQPAAEVGSSIVACPAPALPLQLPLWVVIAWHRSQKRRSENIRLCCNGRVTLGLPLRTS